MARHALPGSDDSRGKQEYAEMRSFIG